MRKIVALGATSLIAQETLKNFAKDKDSFFLIGRNEEKLNEVAKNLEVLGASEVNVKVVKDVCDFKAHQEIQANTRCPQEERRGPGGFTTISNKTA